VHEPRRHLLTRRALLAGTGLGALVAVAGCNPFSKAARTVTVTAEPTTSSQPPAPATPILSLVAITRLHLDHLNQAVASDARDRAVLTMLRNDVQAHLAALEAEYGRSIGNTAVPGTSSSTPPPTGTSSTGANDPDTTLALIRGDAGKAQSAFTDALAGATRYQAELYASIAACVATHRMVLS
jgi:hypothetical protein